MELFIDASGKGGYGVYWADLCIEQGTIYIAWNESYAITIAINTWGAFGCVVVHCDNQTMYILWVYGRKGPVNPLR